MKIIKKFTFAALAVTLLSTLPAAAAGEANHEVWMLDQSNTYDSDGNGTLDSGGKLYIFNGNELAGQAASKASPEMINLGGALAEAINHQSNDPASRTAYLHDSHYSQDRHDAVVPASRRRVSHAVAARDAGAPRPGSRKGRVATHRACPLAVTATN